MFSSRSIKTQIDFILVMSRDRRLLTNAKTMPNETVVTQHSPLLKSIPLRLKQIECEVLRELSGPLKKNAAAVGICIRLSEVTTVDGL